MPEPESIQPTEEQIETTAPRTEEVFPFAGTGNSEDEDAALDRILGIDEPAPRQAARTADTAAPANDPDFDRALKALQRDGVPAEIIDSIRSDPSKVKEWGLKAAKRQADVDAFGASKAKADAAPKQKPQETPKASVETDDGEADADPMSEFAEIFGDEAARPLKAITERMQAALDEKTKAIEFKYETRSAYDRIAETYGADAPTIDEIMDTAAKIGRDNPRSFDSVAALVQEAFRQRAGEPKRRDPRNSMRPTVGRQPARVERTIDREDAVLDILLGGGSKADAMRFLTR